MADTQHTQTRDKTAHEQIDNHAFGTGLHLGRLTEAATQRAHPRHDEATRLLSTLAETLAYGSFDTEWVRHQFYATLEAWRNPLPMEDQ